MSLFPVSGGPALYPLLCERCFGVSTVRAFRRLHIMRIPDEAARIDSGLNRKPSSPFRVAGEWPIPRCHCIGFMLKCPSAHVRAPHVPPTPADYECLTL